MTWPYKLALGTVTFLPAVLKNGLYDDTAACGVHIKGCSNRLEGQHVKTIGGPWSSGAIARRNIEVTVHGDDCDVIAELEQVRRRETAMRKEYELTWEI